MSRLEMLNRSVRQQNARRLAPLAETMQQVQSMEKAVAQIGIATEESAAQLAKALMPIAQSMARLSSEAREKILAIEQSSQGAAEKITAALKQAAIEARSAAKASTSASQKLAMQIEEARKVIEEMRRARASMWLLALAPSLLLLAVMALAALLRLGLLTMSF